jgi:DNA-directed RNA polymerase specialized sigma24 family protein
MRGGRAPTEFETWYERIHPRLVTALAAHCGDADAGREAADETAVRALERWDRVAGMASPDGWAFRTGFNILRRHGRRLGLERRLLRRAEPAAPLAGPASELWVVVAELPARQRQAVLLRHVAQLTEPEIASAMGVTRGTVSSTLRSAHRSLHRRIGDADPEERSPTHG